MLVDYNIQYGKLSKLNEQSPALQNIVKMASVQYSDQSKKVKKNQGHQMDPANFSSSHFSMGTHGQFRDAIDIEMVKGGSMLSSFTLVKNQTENLSDWEARATIEK